MNRQQLLTTCGAFLFVSGALLGIAVCKATERRVAPVVVNFTFVGATPQNVKGLTTAATELLQKKGVLPGFKEER